jgi:hypothetical protein
MPVENEDRERLDGEERLDGLLRSLPREHAPEGLWRRLRVSLRPEARASRELARRRQQFVGGLVAVAASVLMAVGVWYWLTLAGTVEQPATGQVAGSSTSPAPGVPGGQVSSALVAVVDGEGEALGRVHAVYEASNFLPGEMVLATAGEGYENW